MDIKKRNPAADIIRCLALFLVISVHFLLLNGFYYQATDGIRMFVLHIFRAFFINCVPLFITLSGFLLRKKQLNVEYYKRGIKIILTYILASVFCIVFSAVFLKNDVGIVNSFFNILNFSAAPYSWYIEMYLGIFLIIPFLNILYNNVPTKNWKLALVIFFIVLTALPSVINAYNLHTIGFWPFTSLTTPTKKIIPEWWTAFYPITYYFLGCYLSEYGLKIKKHINVALLILFILIFGAYTFWQSYKVNFIWGSWCSYESLFCVIITTLIFAFVTNWDYTNFPSWLSVFLKKVSELCLGGYLLSWIFDETFYPYLNEKFDVATDKIWYYFIIVPAVYILSLLLSYVLSKVQFLLEWLFGLTVKALKRKKEA